MSLVNEMKTVIGYHKAFCETLETNAKLIDIREGNLLEYVLADLKCQLSEESFKVARHRVAPINLLNKIIEKTCTIYTPTPVRRIIDGTDEDSSAFAWHEEKTEPSSVLAHAAELYTMCKSCLIQIYAHNGSPCFRVIPNDRFFVFSTDKVDDMHPTHVVTFERRRGKQGQPVVVYTAYTAEEFLIFDDEENIYRDEMASYGNPEGVNYFGVLPFVYRSSSKYKLFPSPDKDLLAMTKLFPVILSDLNYAAMFQCFSVIWAKNCTEVDAKLSPNALWYVTKDPMSTGEAEIGTIKPTVDYEGVMAVVQSELALWLNSRGIRPGAIGKLDGDNFSNGISKIIDEMDTVELREKLVDVFRGLERELWDTELQVMVPKWIVDGLIEDTHIFSQSAQVQTVFTIQQPLISRGQLVKDAKEELDAEFISRERVLKRLNPTMSDPEIAALIAEIDGVEVGSDANVLNSAVPQNSLNGAQVESLVQILERIAAGTMPKDVGKSVIAAAFALPPEQIANMIDPIVPRSIDLNQTTL